MFQARRFTAFLQRFGGGGVIQINGYAIGESQGQIGSDCRDGWWQEYPHDLFAWIEHLAQQVSAQGQSSHEQFQAAQFDAC